MDGILLYSSSRTQGLIALSSFEAEVYAAVSTSRDAIYMVRCLEFVFEQNVTIQLLLDNSAARQILMRSGVGRVTPISEGTLAAATGGEEDDFCGSSGYSSKPC